MGIARSKLFLGYLQIVSDPVEGHLGLALGCLDLSWVCAATILGVLWAILGCFGLLGFSKLVSDYLPLEELEKGDGSPPTT